MSLYNFDYERELFQDSRKEVKTSKKMEFSYVANCEVVPSTPIVHNVSTKKTGKRFYISDFLERKIKE